MTEKPYKWVVEFTVSSTWVEDGFDLDDERAHRMLAEHLPYAYGHELGARVLSAPDPKRIRVEQGERLDVGSELTTTQRIALAEADDGGYRAAGSGRLRTARALRVQGLVEIGEWNHWVKLTKKGREVLHSIRPVPQVSESQSKEKTP